jgi:hypothetical protein
MLPPNIAYARALSSLPGILSVDKIAGFVSIIAAGMYNQISSIPLDIVRSQKAKIGVSMLSSAGDYLEKSIPDDAGDFIGVNMKNLVGSLISKAAQEVANTGDIQNLLSEEFLINTISEALNQQTSGKELLDTSRKIITDLSNIRRNFTRTQSASGLAFDSASLLQRGFQLANRDYGSVMEHRDITKNPAAEDPTYAIGHIYSRNDARYKPRRV